MVARDESNVLDLGAGLERARPALELQVLDQDGRIANAQGIAVAVLDHEFGFRFVLLYRRIPFVRAIRADEEITILVGVFRCALRAGGNRRHVEVRENS